MASLVQINGILRDSFGIPLNWFFERYFSNLWDSLKFSVAARFSFSNPWGSFVISLVDGRFLLNSSRILSISRGCSNRINDALPTEYFQQLNGRKPRFKSIVSGNTAAFPHHSNSAFNATCYFKSNCGTVASLLTPLAFFILVTITIDPSCTYIFFYIFRIWYNSFWFPFFFYLIWWRTNQGDDTEAI